MGDEAGVADVAGVADLAGVADVVDMLLPALVPLNRAGTVGGSTFFPVFRTGLTALFSRVPDPDADPGSVVFGVVSVLLPATCAPTSGTGTGFRGSILRLDFLAGTAGGTFGTAMSRCWSLQG